MSWDVVYQWRKADNVTPDGGMGIYGFGGKRLSFPTREQALTRAALESWTVRTCVFYMVQNPKGETIAEFRGKERDPAFRVSSVPASCRVRSKKSAPK